MAEIRAFVGHSFDPDDQAVVRTFTDYLESLSSSPMDFTWKSAKKAEPKDLTKKVLSFMADKNVFIGICTKKERVIHRASLSTAFLRRGVLVAPKDEFFWKTSDWIIQEIGLAIGKGLDLILLLESGLLPPGGLQGNIEYIEFDPLHPTDAFDKLFQMISFLLAKASSPSVASPDVKSMPAEEEDESETPTDDHWRVPQPEWKRPEYELALIGATIRSEADRAEFVSQEYLKTDDAQEGDNKNSWEAFREYTDADTRSSACIS